LLKTGTGSFISPDGELLTNYHVISGGSLIMAKMPNGAGRGRLAVFPRCSLLTSAAADARRSRLEKQPTDLRRRHHYM
jgi:hypothetical protein